MKIEDPATVLSWLQKNPSQEELRAAFPAEWEQMEHELAAAVTKRDPARLHRLLRPSSEDRPDLAALLLPSELGQQVRLFQRR